MSKAVNLVIMGVAGAGKSTIGMAAAEALNITYIDGDDLHSDANVRKMSEGIALNDRDRLPWLTRVGTTLSDASAPIVVGCSALKRKYRDHIRAIAGDKTVFVCLDGSIDLISKRMSDRPGHFMPVSLLESQFRDLEIPASNENVISVEIDQPIEKIVQDILNRLSEHQSFSRVISKQGP